MHSGISNAKTIRPPFVAALFLSILCAGFVTAEHLGLVTLPTPSDELIASVLPGAVVALTNEERKDNDLGTLKANALLTRAAQLKADDMAAKSYYAHVSPDGTIPPYWLNSVGYRYQVMGENLVVDRESSEAVVSAWMGSYDHRENILNASFTEIGIGVAYGNYKGRETIYVVQMLARPLGTNTPAQVSVPAPRTLIPIPAPTKTAATTEVLVRAPQPKPKVVDPIAPVLRAVASTTLAEVPSLVASTTYLPPVLGDSGSPIELPTATATMSAASNRASLQEKARVFVNRMFFQVRDFFKL